MDKKKNKLIFIAGPCVIEDKNKTFDIAAKLKDIIAGHPIDFIFKASFYKANRTSVNSFRGPKIQKGLEILNYIKNKLKLKVLSDIHCQTEIKYVRDVLDIIQIPAFLSRQTDLIVEAAKTKKIINIKKAQFMSPHDVKFAIEKVTSTGNKKVFVTERGSCFGYNNLIVDFRSFLIMKEFGFPVIFDVTHSLQTSPLLAKRQHGIRLEAAEAFGIPALQLRPALAARHGTLCVTERRDANCAGRRSGQRPRVNG